MTYEERLEALKEFAERQGWGEVSTWSGSQREPGYGIHIDTSAGRLTFESHDGPTVALAKAEQMLTVMKRAASDVYLHEPHKFMGGL